MATQILVDSDRFWSALSQDIAAAEHSVYVQAMTFEADAAGTQVADAIAAARAPDRRVLIDEFTKYMVSDRFVPSPWHWRDRALREEVAATREMVRTLRKSGARVEHTNPVGPLFLRFPIRNHKKLMVVDRRIAYLGGINFSDHNFAWHDMMVRIEDPDIAGFLHDDFLATWSGKNRRLSQTFGKVEVHVTDGRANPRGFRRIFDLIAGAKRRIFVECPYITFPFIDALAAARRRGVEVTVVTAAVNNWHQLRHYIPWDMRRSGIELRLYRGPFTHLKSMAIDDDCVILGSPNYDVLTYRLHQEVFAVCHDQRMVAAFRDAVIEPDLAGSDVATGPINELDARLRYAQLFSLGHAVRALHWVPE